MNIEELNEEFIKAAMNGDIKGAQKLLKKGAQLNGLTPKGNNALYVAATRKKRDFFNWLLTLEHNGEKIDIDNRNVNGNTLLFDTIKLGDMQYYLTNLLENNANPNIAAYDGMTPLIKAVADGKKEEVSILLTSPKTDINYAIEGTKTTAFLMATTASGGKETLELCKLLLEKGADINARDINGKDALINSIFRTKEFMKRKEKKENQELCKFLIEQNVDINYVAPSGMTAFWMTSMQGNLELAKMMLDKGVTTDVWHSIGLSGVSSALHSWMGILGKDLKDPKDPNAKSEIVDLEFVSRVILAGANLNTPDEDGNTPAIFGYANPYGRQLTFDLGGDVNAILYQKDAKQNIVKTPAISLIVSSGDKQLELVDKMIAEGVKVSFQDDPDMKTKEPIIAAISSSAVGIFKSLLGTKQINPNLALKLSSQSEELNLLSLVVSGVVGSNFSEILDRKAQNKRIIEGKKINDKNGIISPLINDEGIEAIKEELKQIEELELSLETNRKTMFDALLSAGADVNLANDRGYTPIYFATKPERAQWLLDAGANLFTKAGDNDLLLSVIKNNASEMLPFVLEKFKAANHPTVENLFYQLAFTEAKGQYQREGLKGGLLSLLTPEQLEVYPLQYNDPTDPNSGIAPAVPLNIPHIDYQDEDGNSGLLVACATDNAFLVPIYIRFGADINLANENGETPLMHAIGSINYRSVEYMIENGADVNAKTKEGKTILEFAEESGNKQILEVVRIALGDNIAEGQLTGVKKFKH